MADLEQCKADIMGIATAFGTSGQTVEQALRPNGIETTGYVRAKNDSDCTGTTFNTAWSQVKNLTIS